MAERVKMKLVYVAGPYRSATERGLVENILAAEQLALTLWGIGFAVICPHKNTAHFGGACDDSVWLAGDIEMMLRCDAVCLVRGWQRSVGTRAEVEAAKAAGIPVFEEPLALWGWSCGEEGGAAAAPRHSGAPAAGLVEPAAEAAGNVGAPGGAGRGAAVDGLGFGLVDFERFTVSVERPNGGHARNDAFMS